MAEDQVNQNADTSGPPEEAAGRISLDQARVVAMRAAAENPRAYRRRFRNIPMAFEVVEDSETGDHYVVTLSFRPQGEFTVTPGLEEFSIDGQGRVARRRVLNPPGQAERRRLPVALIGIGLAVVVGAAVGGVFAATSGGGGDETPPSQVAAVSTSTTVTPSDTPVSTPTALPAATFPAVAPATSAPTLTPVPPSISTATSIVQATPTPNVTTAPSPIPSLLELELDPSVLRLAAGFTLALRVIVFDQRGIEVPSPSITWSLPPEVGKVDADGVFTASTQAGVFPAAIRVDVTDGDAFGSATLDVAIDAGPLESIKVSPPSPVTRRGESVQLTATGYDGYGNVISGLEFDWESEGGLTVDPTGKVTVGRQVSPPDGLVGWWPGNGKAEDVIGGHNGIPGGGTGYAAGVYGQAFSFDGEDDLIEVEDVDRLDIRGDVTLHFWAKRSILGGPAVMVVKGVGLVAGVDVPTVYVLKFGSAGSPGGNGDYLWGGFERANGSDVFIVGAEVTDTLFHHYAYVRAGNFHKLYLDGVEVANDRFIGLAGGTSGIPLVIGSGPTLGPSRQAFGGIIDEVQIFDRALSDTEVAAYYLAAGPKGSYQVTVRASDKNKERTAVVTVVVE